MKKLAYNEQMNTNGGRTIHFRTTTYYKGINHYQTYVYPKYRITTYHYDKYLGKSSGKYLYGY